jgi:hypothetical protein
MKTSVTNLMNKTLCTHFTFKTIFVSLMICLTQIVQAGSPLDQIPIQDRGRVKPFHSFAQETMQLIHGSKNLKIKETEKSASSKIKREVSEVVMTFMLAPEQWESTKLIRIDYLALKKALGFKADEKYFSVVDVFGASALPALMQTMAGKAERKEKLNPFDQAVQKLESQLGYVRLLQSGEGLRFVPPKTGDQWLSVNQIEGPVKDQFTKVLTSLITSISNKMQPQGLSSSSKDIKDLKEQVKLFISLAQAENPLAYPKLKIINLELHYNKFKPFLWASIFYFLAFLTMILFWVFSKSYFVSLSWVFTLLGLGLHI